jgi:hypothetical protein
VKSTLHKIIKNIIKQSIKEALFIKNKYSTNIIIIVNLKPKDIYADQKRGHLALELEREYLKEIINLKNNGEGNVFISLNDNAIITNLALREKLPIIFHTEKLKSSGFYKIIGKYEHGTFHIKDWSIGNYPKIKTNVNTDYIINKIMDGVEVAGGRNVEEFATLTLISSHPTRMKISQVAYTSTSSAKKEKREHFLSD